MKRRKTITDSTAMRLRNLEAKARVNRAAMAVLNYKNDTGGDLTDAACDLLADLMHWCDRYDQDFDNEVQRAREHYEAEK